MYRATEIVVNLSDGNSFMLGGDRPVIISFERRRLDVRHYLNRVTRALRTQRQAVRVNLSAADAVRKILMRKIGDLQWLRRSDGLDELDSPR